MGALSKNQACDCLVRSHANKYLRAFEKAEISSKLACDKENSPLTDVGARAPMHQLEQLRKGCPDGVDPREKEMHLGNESFFTTFKMSRLEFRALAKWKQAQLKKAAGLF